MRQQNKIAEHLGADLGTSSSAPILETDEQVIQDVFQMHSALQENLLEQSQNRESIPNANIDSPEGIAKHAFQKDTKGKKTIKQIAIPEKQVLSGVSLLNLGPALSFGEDRKAQSLHLHEAAQNAVEVPADSRAAFANEFNEAARDIENYLPNLRDEIKNGDNSLVDKLGDFTDLVGWEELSSDMRETARTINDKTAREGWDMVRDEVRGALKGQLDSGKGGGAKNAMIGVGLGLAEVLYSSGLLAIDPLGAGADLAVGGAAVAKYILSTEEFSPRKFNKGTQQLVDKFKALPAHEQIAYATEWLTPVVAAKISKVGAALANAGKKIGRDAATNLGKKMGHVEHALDALPLPSTNPMAAVAGEMPPTLAAKNIGKNDVMFSKATKPVASGGKATKAGKAPEVKPVGPYHGPLGKDLILTKNGYYNPDTYHKGVGDSVKSAAPTDPIRSLENSKLMEGGTSKKPANRIYYDAKHEEIVIFRHEGVTNDQPIWHANATTWECLERDRYAKEMNFLVKHFEFNRQGKYKGGK